MNSLPPRRTLAACCTAHAVHDGLADMSYVLLPMLAQTFNLSLAQVGLVRSALRAAMALFQAPAGLAAERLGARNLLAFGTAFAGLAYIGLGQASGFAAVLLALFFAGFGSAFQHPICSTLISHAYPGDGRRAALGTYNFAGDIGKFAFGGTISMLAVAGVPWQVPVTAFGSLGIAVALTLLIVLDRGVAIAANPGADRAPVAGWGIRHRGGFAALCAIEIIDNAVRTGFLTFIAFLMLDRNLPAGWAALSVPLVLIGGMAGKLACGFLAERIGVVRTIVLTEIATGAGILLLLVLPDLAAYLLLPLIGVALNGTSSALYATIGDLVDRERLPRAFGLFYTLGSTCGLVAPLALGMLGDRIGVADAMLVTAALAFLTLPACLVLRPALQSLRR
jgi:FSR family fosmidomycin resistance protein-like MFS transporter